MKTRLIIDENTVYEVDEECLNRRQPEERRCNEKAVKSNNKNNSENVNRSNYNNRFNNR